MPRVTIGVRCPCEAVVEANERPCFYLLRVPGVKKADRISKAADRTARQQHSERKEAAMRSFIDVCRSCMRPNQWSRYYPEAIASAGETLHIVEYLVFALTVTQTTISPNLRKAIDAVIEVCEIDRDRWTDLRKLNYDAYWRARYGYTD